MQDEFGEKAKTVPLAALGVLAETVGVDIFVAGVLTCASVTRVLLALAPHNARICIITAGIGNQRKFARNGG